MRSTIFEFSQEMALKKGLNPKDLLLLSYLFNWIQSGNVLFRWINKVEYFKITYNKILKDLPIVFKNRLNIYRCLKKLEKSEVLKIYNDNQKRLYVALNYNALLAF